MCLLCFDEYVYRSRCINFQDILCEALHVDFCSYNIVSLFFLINMLGTSNKNKHELPRVPMQYIFVRKT